MASIKSSLATIGAVLILISYVSIAQADKHNDFLAASYQCLNASINAGLITTANTTCLRELNLTTAGSNAKLDRNKCLKICILKKVGVIGADDKISTAGVSTFVDGTFAAPARAALKTGISACAATALDAEGGHSSEEDTTSHCHQYKSLMICISKAVKKACTPAAAALASQPEQIVKLLTQSNSTGQAVQMPNGNNNPNHGAAGHNHDHDDDE